MEAQSDRSGNGQATDHRLMAVENGANNDGRAGMDTCNDLKECNGSEADNPTQETL